MVNVYLIFTLQLLRECKDVLLGGVLVKDYYLYLVDGVVNLEDSSSENTESDIEGFEQDLQSLLQVHVTLMLLYYHSTVLKAVKFSIFLSSSNGVCNLVLKGNKQFAHYSVNT